MSGSLDDEYQMVWMPEDWLHPVVWINEYEMDVRWPGYMSPSGGRGLSGGLLHVQIYTQALM